MPKTRYSKQRELIYENLKARCDHPTAEAIYSDLKKDNPGLSLGTVYRNLNFLADAKMIRKLDVSDHYHFICNECNQVFDITYHDENISNVVQEHTKHHIEKTDIVFSGICEECLKKKN